MSSPPLVVTRTSVPAGLRLKGEIDESNVDQVRAALEAHCATLGPLHLDLSELVFCDVSGIRGIVSFARGLDRDRRIVLHGMPAQLEKVLNLVGWAEVPGVTFCNCKLET